MTALLWTRRRAESFDALIEGGRLDGDTVDGVDRQTAELLELVGALRSVPAAEPRAEFVTGLRERLMLAAETELTPAGAGRERDLARLTIKPGRTRRERRVSLALGAAAIVGATTSMAVASQSAIPGDALYPLKRVIENTQAGLSVGDDAKGKTILDNASGRLDEVDALTSASDPDPTLVAQTLDTFADQASQAGGLLITDYQENGDPAAIRAVHQFASDSIDTLVGLEGSIPVSAHDALLQAAQTVLQIDAEAAQVCSLAECGDSILEVPGELLADATTGQDPATGTQAGAALAGTSISADAKPSQHPQNGGKDNGRPSAVDPPASPVALPSGGASSPSDTASSNPGGALPTIGTQSGQGSHQNGHHGGKDKPDPDLGPVTGTVTDTVNHVVDGVVDGVNGLLNGLSGNQTPQP